MVSSAAHDIGVSASLAAGQRAGEPPEIGEMLGNPGSFVHRAIIQAGGIASGFRTSRMPIRHTLGNLHAGEAAGEQLAIIL